MCVYEYVYIDIYMHMYKYWKNNIILQENCDILLVKLVADNFLLLRSKDKLLELHLFL